MEYGIPTSMHLNTKDIPSYNYGKKTDRRICKNTFIFLQFIASVQRLQINENKTIICIFNLHYRYHTYSSEMTHNGSSKNTHQSCEIQNDKNINF